MGPDPLRSSLTPGIPGLAMPDSLASREASAAGRVIAPNECLVHRGSARDAVMTVMVLRIVCGCQGERCADCLAQYLLQGYP